LIIAPYEYYYLLIYLLTYVFLVMAVLWTCELKFLLEGLECYKYIQMKAYDIKKTNR